MTLRYLRNIVIYTHVVKINIITKSNAEIQNNKIKLLFLFIIIIFYPLFFCCFIIYHRHRCCCLSNLCQFKTLTLWHPFTFRHRSLWALIAPNYLTQTVVKIMSFNHSKIAWGIDAYADRIQWSGHHPMTSPTLSRASTTRTAMWWRVKHLFGAISTHSCRTPQRYRSRQAQQRAIRPPARKMQMHQQYLNPIWRWRHVCVRKGTLRHRKQVWLEQIKLVRTERDMLFLEMQAQATLGLDLCLPTISITHLIGPEIGPRTTKL